MNFDFHKHKTAKRLLEGLGIFLSILILLIITIVIFSEPLIKSFTNHKAEGKIGRSFSIEGPLEINWSWNKTTFHAEDIRLGNKEGYTEPHMATIEALDFTFVPAKLLIGKLQFGDITVTKPTVILEKKAEGDANWNFPATSNANLAGEAALPSSRHNFPYIGQLTLNGGHIIYRDAIKKLNLDLTLDSVSGTGGGAKRKEREEGFKISGTGTMQGQTFNLDASGGSLDTLRESDEEFPLYLKLVMGPTEILVDGKFADPIKMTGVDAALRLKGHNMADLFYLTAIPLPPTPPYTLTGQLTKRGEIWGYQNFEGKVGGSDLSGNLSYDTSGERGFFKANLLSHVMNAEDLGGFIGLSPSGKNAAPEQKQAAAKKKASPKLIPAVPLKLDRLRATDMDVALKAEKINAPGLPFKGMDVRFDLQNGLLKLDPLSVVLADGTVDGTIQIDGSKDVPPMEMNLNLNRLSLGQFFDNTRFANTTRGFFGGKVNLSGRGKSLADVLATSNGKLTIIMSGGKMSLLLVEASDLDIGQAFPLFMGKDKSTPIRCGVADFDVKNGLLNSKVFVLDTADSMLVGNVGIDMKRELINAKLDSRPKDNSLLSIQAPIKVSGKLKEPSIGVDAAQAGGRTIAAAALGALLTPFAAILPFIETGKVENADCRRLIANAGK